jgi:hypothetical protein
MGTWAFTTITKGIFKDFPLDINLDIATIIANLGIGQRSTPNFNMDHNNNITWAIILWSIS